MSSGRLARTHNNDIAFVKPLWAMRRGIESDHRGASDQREQRVEQRLTWPAPEGPPLVLQNDRPRTPLRKSGGRLLNKWKNCRADASGISPMSGKPGLDRIAEQVVAACQV